jgi:hypothetical protein
MNNRRDILRYHVSYHSRIQFVDQKFNSLPTTESTPETFEFILDEVLVKTFDSDIEKMTLKEFEQLILATAPRTHNLLNSRIDGRSFLEDYALARLKADHPEEFSKLAQGKLPIKRKVQAYPGYSILDTFNFFKLRRSVKYSDFKTHGGTTDALPAYIERIKLQELLDNFSDNPAVLARMIEFLRPSHFTKQNVVDFVQAYVGLNVEKRLRPSGQKKIEPWEQRRTYIEAIVQTFLMGEKLNLSQSSLQRQVDLLVRISRTEFQVDPSHLVHTLANEAVSFTKTKYPKLRSETLNFLKEIHQKASEHFQQILDFEIHGMKTQPFPYQREGASFLASKANAILADDAGLGKSYQALAAFQSLKLRKGLWITTASNIQNIRSEILEHSELKEEWVFPLTGSPESRKRFIENWNGTGMAIISYETLVKIKKDSQLFKKLTEDIDALIVDEAQMIDNPEALRSEAVRAMNPKRKWLLSATPYQSKVQKLWTLLNFLDPEKFPDSQAFNTLYTQDTEGLFSLHFVFSEYMMRRTKSHTLPFFENPSIKSFYDQLKTGIPRIPKKRRSPIDEMPHYELSLEQSQLIARMIADFKSWAEAFNLSRGSATHPVPIESINPLMKFEYIHRVIYEPEYFGITTPNPLYGALEKNLSQKIQADQKVILFGWNVSVLEKLKTQFSNFGVVKIDGSTSGDARSLARNQFQNDSETRLLLANYLSGGVGLTLSAANTSIFAQIPLSYPLLLQAESRHQRVIGLSNLKHAKEYVDIEWIIPKYPQHFLDSIEDPKLRELLSAGTLVEQTCRRLQGGELIYHLVLEGLASTEDLEKHFQGGLLASLGLVGNQRLAFNPKVSKKVAQLIKSSQSFFELWKKVEKHTNLADRVLRLIEVFRFEPELGKKLNDVLVSTSDIPLEDLDLILEVFEIRNKYIRNQLLKKIPTLLSSLYASGKNLKQVSAQIRIERLNPISFIALVYTSSQKNNSFVSKISMDLSKIPSSPETLRLQELFFTGIFGVLDNPKASTILESCSDCLSQTNLKESIQLIYEIGLIARIAPDLLEQGHKTTNVSTFKDIQGLVSSLKVEIFSGITGVPLKDVSEYFKRNKANLGDHANDLLALVAGWVEFGDTQLLEQFKEIYGSVLKGTFKNQRYENGFTLGQPIYFLNDNIPFWSVFGKNVGLELKKPPSSNLEARQSLFRQFSELFNDTIKSIYEDLSPHLPPLEKLFDTDLSPDLQKKVHTLGLYFSDGVIGNDLERLLQTIGVELNDRSAPSLARIKELKNKLNDAQIWLRLYSVFHEIQSPETLEDGLFGLSQYINTALQGLGTLAMSAHRSENEDLALKLQSLLHQTRYYKEKQVSETEFFIQETDHPMIFASMGALRPELTNCFNPRGNPTFTQYVLTAAGSKNMKLLVVREKKSGNPVAVSMFKLKKTQNGEPVLFLEAGLFHEGYSFKNEMLAFLKMKADQLGTVGPKPIVMMDVGKNTLADDPIVESTGAYTKNEYIEAVFGFRESAYAKHRGRIWNGQYKVEGTQLIWVQSEQIAPKRILGFGLNHASIESLVGDLKNQGVTVLIDVRDWPGSRYKPFLNGVNLARTLQENGIAYVWKGDKLGNSFDQNGVRSLEGFDQKRNTPLYQEGLQDILEIAKNSQGRVAIACIEKDETQCHRQTILKDIEKNFFVL